MLSRQVRREVKEYFSKEKNTRVQISSCAKRVTSFLAGENNGCKGPGRGLCLDLGGVGLGRWYEVSLKGSRGPIQ